LQRAFRRKRRRTWPADPRIDDYERVMHVNEQTLRTMRGYLKAARFERVRSYPGDWIYVDFVPEERARSLYRRLAALPVLKRFGVADIYGEGAKPKP
jgi:hypothetical protein